MGIQEKPRIDWTQIDTKVEHRGKKIVLPDTPAPMDYDVAIETLERVRDQESQEYDVVELVAGAPWDAAVAVYRAMQEIYGVVIAENQQTWFGEIRPDFITVVTGCGEHDRVQVPMGQMRLPNVSNPVQVHMTPEGVVIRGTVRRRDRAILVEIANCARRFLREASVYKGKAVIFNVDEDGNLVINKQPEFIDLSAVSESDMIHTAETAALIRTNIFSPLKHTEACRKHKIPLKRGILLEGRYGTGKSLTARVTAKVATDNGWTFIMLNRAQGLRAAIEFARTYQPCVVFAEDIDRVADREDENVNDLVNMLDGVVTKDMEMMICLTTNFIEKIDQALLRPGRFDAIISIQPPDETTSVELIRAYARDLLDETEDLSRVGEALAGAVPATIREVVERAKMAMLMEGREKISADNLYVSAIGMKRHMELLEPKPKGKTPAELFAEGFIGLLEGGLDINSEAATSYELLDARNKIIRRVAGMQDNLNQVSMMSAASATASKTAADYSKRSFDILRNGLAE
jgi:transitional endoplasmic reticulum ATPase